MTRISFAFLVGLASLLMTQAVSAQSFPYGVFGTAGIQLSGAARIDGFDPSTGRPDAVFIGSNGDITNSAIPPGGIFGNAFAHGQYLGSGPITGGAIGGMPLVSQPSVSPCTPYSPLSVVSLSGGATYDPATGNLTLNRTTALVTLFTGTTYCFGNVNLTAPGAAIQVVGGTTAVVSLTGLIHANMLTSINASRARSLSILSSAQCVGVCHGFNGGVGTFTLYSPDADVGINGSSAITGALVGRKVTLTGAGAVHYDASLR